MVESTSLALYKREGKGLFTFLSYVTHPTSQNMNKFVED